MNLLGAILSYLSFIKLCWIPLHFGLRVLDTLVTLFRFQKLLSATSLFVEKPVRPSMLLYDNTATRGSSQSLSIKLRLSPHCTLTVTVADIHRSLILFSKAS